MATAQSLQIPFEKVSAMIATVSAQTRQAPELVGSAINSILSRVESVRKTGYDSADGTTINQVSQSLSKAGIQLTDTNGQFRNFSTVLDELATKWSGLDTVTQRYIATTVAGTRNQTQFLSLMSNYTNVLDLNNQALNAAGTTQSKYNLYLDGTQSSIDRLTAQMQTLFSSSFKSEGIKSLIDALGGLLTVTNSVVSSVGLLPTVAALASVAFFALKKDALQGFYDILKSLPKAMEDFRLSLVATATTTEGLSVAVKGLGVALLSIGEFLLPIAIIAGLTYGITSLFSAISDHNQALKEATTLNYDNVNSLTAQKKGLSDLTAEYSTLKAAQDAGDATIDQKQRLLAVQQELVDKYGVSVTGINAEGQAYSDSISLINARSKALQDQIDKENLLNKTKLEGKDSSNTSDILSASSGVDTAKKKLDDYQNQLTEFEKRAKSGHITNSDNFLPDVPSQLDITTKDNPDSVNNIREGLNYQIGILQTQFEAANTKLQTSLKDRVQILNDESTQYIKSLTDNGTKVSDQERNFIQQLTGTIAKDGKSLDVQIEEIKTAIKKLDSSDFNKILDDFNTAQANGDTSKMSQDKKQVLELLDTIVGSGKEFDDFKSKIMLLFGDGTPTKEALSFDASLKNLDDTITSTDKSITDLATAYQTLQGGQQLSTDETLKLADKYPQLLDYLVKHNGLITDKGAILTQVANIDRETALAEAQNLKNNVDDTYNALEAKRKMYADFYSKVSQINEVFGTFGGSKPKGFGANNSPFQMSPDDIAAEADAKKQQEELQLRIQLLSKPVDLSKVNKTGGGAGTTPVDQSFTKYTTAARTLDGQLTTSNATLDKLNTTSQAYRNELEKQIPIYQQKQVLAKQEADDLRAQDVALQHRLDTEKLNTSQQNTLKNQMDANMTKIAGLSANWLTYDKTISDIANKNSLSLVNEEIQKSADSTKVFDDKIKNLKTSMDSLKTDPAGKIADQNELLKTYQEEATSIVDSDAKLEALSKTLDKNSDAWKTNNDQLTSNKAKLDQIGADSDALRTSIAGQVIDSMKHAIQVEIDAEKSLHDQKIKDIDDATQKQIDAIDKVQAANDKAKTLEKDQTDLQKLQTERNAYILDTSNEGRSQVADLDQKIADQKEKITDEQTKNQNDTIKQGLQDQNKSLKDNVDDQSKIKTDALTNQLNDDTHWLSLETDLINGHVTAIQSSINGIIDGLGKYGLDSLAAVTGQVTKVQAEISKLSAMSSQITQLSQTSTGATLGSDSSLNVQGQPVINAPSNADQIAQMKANSAEWGSANAARKSYLESQNQDLGARLGATYDSKTGKWMKGGLPLYHDGGEVGMPTSLGQKLHKLLNLGQGEFPSILKDGEFVIKNPANALTNLMSRMPDFSKIMPKSGAGGVNNFNVSLGNINVSGDQNGGNIVLDTVVNGLKRLGVNINQH